MMPATQTTPTAPQATPGPWHVSPMGERGLYGNNGELAVIAEERICAVNMVAVPKRGEAYKTACPVRDANARLIAAAPDLLAALEKATIFTEAAVKSMKLHDHGLVAQCRAAIAKARGQ